MQIGSVVAKNNAVLAPMSGVTDLPFRRLANQFGAGLVVSEMAASQTLVHDNPETVLKMAGEGLETHIVQLAGREAHWMAEAAKIARGAGADVIDINMGCPAKKVVTGYSGSALMKNLSHALSLIEATVEAVDCPVTVKMRLGWDETMLNAAELASRAEVAGAMSFTVHGRTRCQFYKGVANWDAVRSVVEAVSVPVLVNGDIVDELSAREALMRSGAAGVMIGRGCYGRPWIVGQIGAALAGDDRIQTPRGDALCAIVEAHYDALLSHYGAELGVRIARKHLGWYLNEVNPENEIEFNKLKGSLMTSHDPKAVVSAFRRCVLECSSYSEAA